MAAALAAAAGFAAVSVGAADAEEGQVTWTFDNLEKIGGHAVAVEGRPRVIDTPDGKAIEFDGVDDGIFLNVHPFAGMAQFTAEVVFQPYPDGLKEQRFVHIQEDSSDERLMFETRLTDDGKWYLDTFLRTGESNNTQLAKDHLHPIGPWYHAAVVVDGKTFTHYVNGEKELSTVVTFTAQKPGRTSVGVRQNKVYWYKGAVRVMRFTPRALEPGEFLKARSEK